MTGATCRPGNNWYAAKYNYDNTVQNFELGLRNLYLKVKDCQQILAASRTALAVEQDNYTAAQLTQQLQKNGLGVGTSVKSLELTYSSLGNVIQATVHWANGQKSTIERKQYPKPV